MARTYGKYGPRLPGLGWAAFRIIRPIVRWRARRNSFYEARSAFAEEKAASFRQRLERGETVYLVGLGVGGHNSGTSLVEVSPTRGINLVSNNEEERYTGIKHYSHYPELGIEVLKQQMADRGVRPQDVHAYVATWNYIQHYAASLQSFFEELPSSLAARDPRAFEAFTLDHMWKAITSPSWLGPRLGFDGPCPVIGLRHHDNHAYFSYAVSPFANSSEPVIVIAVDGTGDEGATSFYVARGRELQLVYANHSIHDSLGDFYSFLSSGLGGWTILSSEGRYMGAAAWGNQNRLTNPYYSRLRQLVYFGPKGRIYINRKWANWQNAGSVKPFSEELMDVIGPAVSPDQMWNPDAILNVENVEHSPITRERVDKAAAVQLVFEDMLFHMVRYLIESTGASRLVLTGGSALNCIANMRLLEYFNDEFYERYFNKKETRLELWVPPTPGDAGAPMGAAYHFALRHGGAFGEPLRHAFYCGQSPTDAEIREALNTTPEISHEELGSVGDPDRRDEVADLVALVVSSNEVVGLFQGAAETGPRALGHRTILANPCNPRTRENLNALVKFRELVRPLAPMATYEAAHRWFDLPAGACADKYNAYNYMVLTARARPEAYGVIPAVIHADGTGRVQIVREDIDPFCHAYLKAMGRRVGAEVSVNTSLNVGSPIVQSPAQALVCLKRSKGMTCLLMISAESNAYLVWHDVLQPPKDKGEKLLRLVRSWKAKSSVGVPS